jgi:hypothetical protein
MDHNLNHIPFHPNPPIGWIAIIRCVLGRKIRAGIKSDQEEKDDFFHKRYLRKIIFTEMKIDLMIQSSS